jgi:hypothetical protein
MAGTINLSLSQQFSNTGRPLSGGRLYFYRAASTAPQNAYKDTALTLPHPNPIILDSSARVPEFWLADGNIKFVLTDKNGVVQISSTSTQVLGPSSGTSGGSTVDSTTLFQTGDLLWLDVSGTRDGWVRPPPVRPNAQTQIAKHCFCLDGRRLRPGLSDGVSMAAGVPPQPPTGQRTSTSHCRTSVVMSQAALPTWEILQLVGLPALQLCLAAR